jgi:hypothetical protein
MTSTLSCERYAHGERPPGFQPDDMSAVRAIERADEAFLARHPAHSFVAALESRRRARSAVRFTRIGFALAACLAVAIAAALPGRAGTRAKGEEAHIFAYKLTQAGTSLLEPDDVLAAGDEIQVAYYIRGRAYVAIVSIDGRGSVTRHMPLHGDEALSVETKSYSLLPYSYRLDDAPGFEDIYLVVSPKAFKLGPISASLSKAFETGSPEVDLPPGLTYAELRVKKQGVRE